MLHRPIAYLLIVFCLIFTQTAQAYSPAWLTHQSTQHNTNKRQAAVSLINNKGDIGATLNDMGKSENIRNLALAMVTAGALQGLNTSLGIQNVNAKSLFVDQLKKNLIDNAASATINTAINGGSLEANLESGLKNAFIDTGAAQGANGIGDLYQSGKINDFTHLVAHAIAGCAAGAAKSGDCSSGALGAAVGELSAQLYGGARLNSSNLDIPALQTDTVNFARMMSGIAVALTGGDTAAINLAADAGGNAAQNNYLNHQRPAMLVLSEAERYAAAKDGCANGDASACQVKTNLEQLSLNRDNQIAKDCNSGAAGCSTGMQAAVNNGSSLGRTSNGSLYVMSPEYASMTDGSVQDPSKAGINAILNEHQQWANAGTPALMLVSGPVGLLTSTATVAAGSYQLGQGIGAFSSGDYGIGLSDTTMGLLGIAGGFGGASASMSGKVPSIGVGSAMENDALYNFNGDLNASSNAARNQYYGNGSSASPSPGSNTAGSSGVGVNSSSFTYSAMNPGPLPDYVAGTFSGGRYSVGSVNVDQTFFKAGDASNPGGSFFNFEAPQSIAQARIDNAVKPYWIDPSTGAMTGASPINSAISAEFPVGTTYYYGPVSTQGGVYLGGLDKIQIYVPNARAIGTFTPIGPLK